MGRGFGSLRFRRIAVLAAIGLIYLAIEWQRGGSNDRSEGLDGASSTVAVETLFAERRSGVFVEIEGEVLRMLADDERGSRHQRFIVELAGGHTLLISHNIDLASKVPIRRGDRVAVRGEYEWNDRGGLLHWTHDDPQGRRTGGWIRHRGEIYR